MNEIMHEAFSDSTVYPIFLLAPHNMDAEYLMAPASRLVAVCPKILRSRAVVVITYLDKFSESVDKLDACVQTLEQAGLLLNGQRVIFMSLNHLLSRTTTTFMCIKEAAQTENALVDELFAGENPFRVSAFVFFGVVEHCW